MAAALGTKLAEVLARCIYGSHLARPQAEDWVKRTCTMLHKTTWTRVRELKAQPRRAPEALRGLRSNCEQGMPRRRERRGSRVPRHVCEHRGTAPCRAARPAAFFCHPSAV
jgi:hypothetical protein